MHFFMKVSPLEVVLMFLKMTFLQLSENKIIQTDPLAPLSVLYGSWPFLILQPLHFGCSSAKGKLYKVLIKSSIDVALQIFLSRI